MGINFILFGIILDNLLLSIIGWILIGGAIFLLITGYHQYLFNGLSNFFNKYNKFLINGLCKFFDKFQNRGTKKAIFIDKNLYKVLDKGNHKIDDIIKDYLKKNKIEFEQK